jgi:hypothetical protein
MVFWNLYRDSVVYAMATWSKEFLLEFIEEFRGYPCIWKEYHNHEMKESAYSALMEKVKTVDHQANKESVMKKINNLRSSFRKERKKVLMAKKSGMSSEDLLCPEIVLLQRFVVPGRRRRCLAEGFKSCQ